MFVSYLPESSVRPGKLSGPFVFQKTFVYLHYAVMAHVEIIVIIAERSAFYAGRSLCSLVALRSPTSDSGRFGFTLKPETVAVDLFQ